MEAVCSVWSANSCTYSIWTVQLLGLRFAWSRCSAFLHATTCRSSSSCTELWPCKSQLYLLHAHPHHAVACRVRCRAGAYADAVEEYTLAVRLDPAAVPAYTNRAAAYLKLKEWQAAVADCDLALALLEGDQGERWLVWRCCMLLNVCVMQTYVVAGTTVKAAWLGKVCSVCHVQSSLCGACDALLWLLKTDHTRTKALLPFNGNTPATLPCCCCCCCVPCGCFIR
jgi:tetratricopeptide (TPR) repeat protein